MTKLPFEHGITHYDRPPPDAIDDLEGLRRADRLRFANELPAWIEVEDGRIVDHGHSGGGQIASSTVRLGSKENSVRGDSLSRESGLHWSGAKSVSTAWLSVEA
jgi:hypothetical protein